LPLAVLALFGSLLALTSQHACASDLLWTDDNPMQMPAVGSFRLRVLTPTLLELTLINTKNPDPARVTAWDFVGDNLQLNLPAPNEFAVTADGQAISVVTVGFKRRPLYAPLKGRDLRIENEIYLELASPVADSQTVVVTNPDGQLWTAPVQYSLVADPLRLSPAVHVNQLGYVPSFPKKAMVGYYLGSLGEMSIPTGNGFQLVDPSGAVVFQGQLAPRVDQGYTYTPLPYQQVWQADFSAFSTPGEYRLVVPGLGASYPFVINEGVAAAFARTYALGIFHQRCGMDEELPYTRFIHGICHAAPVQVPDMTFTAVNQELASMTSDYASYQTAPQLKDVNSSLYPFVDLSNRDVSGGHHDAGDYSKYTINSAGFVHYLIFAADAFPGVASLDNLGIPESGDGIGDILQEAKWEADFLAKMQDSDGGFYFLVYPRDRQYEDDVLPDKGDPQVVFPKTTSVTAAAVAALAEAGSSPAFKKQFPVEAANYLQKAQAGWAFLQNAIAKYGKDGAYQKITHYGNEFGHNDELAWAACALFVATGDQSYHQQLKAWYDPSDPNTLRWSWWRLFEGYGCAVRTYAFAARSGRLPASALDPAYLAKCEAQIQAAAADHVRFANETAYGTSFPDPDKAYRDAGWYFSSERAFDVTVAYQLNPSPDYLDTIIGNLNYESGCNPVNVAYITGIGSRRQREIVSQYAENDRRVLPPSGLPLGNVQSSFQYLDNYQGDLEGTTYPADGSTTAPYPYYDRWGDSFNTTTEAVITDQARSLASLAFWMAQTSLKDQPWMAMAGQVTGLPAQVPASQNITATLVVPGLDLSGARVVWEGRDQEPQFGNPITFAANTVGEQWVEAEAQLVDGRRIFVATNFLATTALDTPPNADESTPLAPTSDMVALYHLDSDLSDALGKHSALALAGNAALDSSNLGWMANRQGAALHFNDLGDTAIVQLSGPDMTLGSDTTAIILEAMVYVDAFVAYNRDVAPIVSLNESWNALLEFGEDKYAGPYVRGGTQMDVMASTLTNALTPQQWHHLAMEINQTSYVLRIDGAVVATASSNELPNWADNSSAKLELGNFSGWIDEVVVRNVRTGAPPVASPSVSLIAPANGSAFVAPATVTLSANASDSDGSISTIEFFQGSTKIGEVSGGAYPYTFVWNGVPVGNYSLTAKATDSQGAVSTSPALVISVTPPQQATAAPSLVPNGGTFLNSAAVDFTSATSGATIRYTTDGTNPTASSPIYTGSVLLDSTSTVKAQAFMAGMADSTVSSATFVVTALGSAGNRVTFVATDSLTQGTWKGTYGLDGYSILGDNAKLPSYAKLSANGNVAYTWGDASSDVRALERASGSGRVAACWYTSTSMTLNFSFEDGKTHRLGLYLLDWDRSGRTESIDVLDGSSNAVLDSQTLSDFAEGKYLIWDLQGQIKIRITRLSGPNALVTGLFFGPRISLAGDVSVAPLLVWSGGLPGANTLGHALNLQLSGEGGQTYVLEGSTDLVTWAAVATNTLAASTLDLSSLITTTDQAHQFYRARCLTTDLPQYLVEESSDLTHWVPLSVTRATNDLSGFAASDEGTYPNRFYRAVPLTAGEQLYILDASPDQINWTPLQTQTTTNLPTALLQTQSTGATNEFYRVRPLY
jgi:hypothetical protein